MMLKWQVCGNENRICHRVCGWGMRCCARIQSFILIRCESHPQPPCCIDHKQPGVNFVIVQKDPTHIHPAVLPAAQPPPPFIVCFLLYYLSRRQYLHRHVLLVYSVCVCVRARYLSVRTRIFSVIILFYFLSLLVCKQATHTFYRSFTCIVVCVQSIHTRTSLSRKCRYSVTRTVQPYFATGVSINISCCAHDYLHKKAKSFRQPGIRITRPFFGDVLDIICQDFVELRLYGSELLWTDSSRK